MKKKYEWVYCVRQASGNSRWKTRWMWNYMKAKAFKKNSITQAETAHTQLKNDEIAIGFDAKTLWQICGLNVQRWYENDLLSANNSMYPHAYLLSPFITRAMCERETRCDRCDDFAVLQFALKEIKKYNCSINFKIMAYVRRFSLSHALQSCSRFANRSQRLCTQFPVHGAFFCVGHCYNEPIYWLELI